MAAALCIYVTTVTSYGRVMWSVTWLNLGTFL